MYRQCASPVAATCRACALCGRLARSASCLSICNKISYALSCQGVVNFKHLLTSLAAISTAAAVLKQLCADQVLERERDFDFINLGAGIDLVEVDSQTWSQFAIPDSLDTDADELCTAMGADSCEGAGLTMFSGATADDMATFTRQGREMHGIVAPLSGLSRAAVNSLSRVNCFPWLPKVLTSMREGPPQVLTVKQISYVY